MPKPFDVFISYSHNDTALRKELDKHLSVLKDQKIIRVWTDGDISPGTEWEAQIQEKLDHAQIILLLVSADFLASPFCRSVEMAKAIERHKANTARVVPIILRPVLWEIAPFGKLQALPLSSENRPLPVTSWPERDDALKNIALEIHAIAEELEQKERASTPSFVGSAVVADIESVGRAQVSPLHPLSGRVSRRVAISSVVVLIAGGAGVTWWTLAEMARTVSQHPTTNPLLLLYQGHHEAVWRVRWSLDGRRIASGGSDDTVQIWYAYSGRPFYVYDSYHNNIRAIAWSPDSTSIAFGGDNKTVQVWNIATGNLIYSYYGNTNIVWDLAWSPDGSRIASAGWDKTVQVWDAQTGQHIYTYRGHSDTVRSIAWSPDSTRIASASRDLLVQVWEADTGRSIFSYRGNGDPTDTLMCVAWSPNGTYIVSSGWDKTVQVWEAITGNHIYTYSGHSEVVMEVAWSHDSKRIASASTDKTVQVWEALTGSHAYIYRGHTSRVYTVTWSPDGRYLASGQDRVVHVWQPS